MDVADLLMYLSVLAFIIFIGCKIRQAEREEDDTKKQKAHK